MNHSPLQRIQNWSQLANEAGYSVKALAKLCGVSVRALEVFFLAVMRESPHRWLKRLRMQRAAELLRDGSNVNQTADCLGYHDRSHFSREFKKHYGLAPKRFTAPTGSGETASFSHSATQFSNLATKMRFPVASGTWSNGAACLR
jgi:transcriptional regulator GlxA family with amidase domain